MEGGGVSAKPVWAPNHAFYKRYILRLQLCYEVMISMPAFSMIETVCIGYVCSETETESPFKSYINTIKRSIWSI